MNSARHIHTQRGLVLLAMLIGLSIWAVVLMKTSQMWSTIAERQREAELLVVGDEYVKAIQRFYFAPASGGRRLPTSIAELLRDDRFPQPVRHLREAYPDPMQPDADWGLVRIGSGIAGVYSTSRRVPLKKAGFDRLHEGFSTARTVHDWQFVFRPPALPWTGSQLPNTESAQQPERHPAVPVQPRKPTKGN
ncbi:type II secretion system protein [Ramlibacter sp. MMS24-I3-19]|uniref:type II secretion system protein n=1 Tax=Ramlibacter sp. MMS24-I3-19 TaxID=3416606 RepID=UPI003CFC4577